jgi:hypothetical protein
MKRIPTLRRAWDILLNRSPEYLMTPPTTNHPLVRRVLAGLFGVRLTTHSAGHTIPTRRYRGRLASCTGHAARNLLAHSKTSIHAPGNHKVPDPHRKEVHLDTSTRLEGTKRQATLAAVITIAASMLSITTMTVSTNFSHPASNATSSPSHQSRYSSPAQHHGLRPPNRDPFFSGADGTVDHSTHIYAYESPDSRSILAIHSKGDSVRVICKSTNKYTTAVPNNHSRSPRLAAWYQLDDGSWVRATYIKVEDISMIQPCP